MKKSFSILSMAAALLITAPQTFGARQRSAEETPIITIRSNAYQEVGPENAFGFQLGTTEADYYDIDCGFGLEELETKPWSIDPETGSIVATYKSIRVSEDGLIRVYGDPEKVDYICVQGGYVTEIDMEKCKNLEVLDLSHNSLQKLDLTPFTNLYAIYLTDNPFTRETPLKIGAPKNRLAILEIDIIDHLDQSFNLSDYPSMQAFDAYHNMDLYNVDPTGCPNLLTLCLEMTNVSSLDVTQNPQLRSLNIAETRVSSIDLSNNPLLGTLMADHASGNFNVGHYLREIDLSKLPNLTILYLGGNRLENVDLTHNTKLTNLNLRENRLTSLDLSKNTALYSVTITANDMDFATLPAPQDTWGEYFYLQNAIRVSKSIAAGSSLDLSSRVLRPGTQTEAAVWKKAIDGNDEMIDPSLYSYENGIVTFPQAMQDSVYVKYSNSLLADYKLSTTPFMVKEPSEIGQPSVGATITPASGVSSFEMSVGIYGATPENPVTFLVDFGDGIRREFTAATEGLPESANVTGNIVEGKTIQIYMPEEVVMTALSIIGQPLTALDVQTAPELRVLKINNTGLSLINLAANRCLETLDLNNNKLSELDLTGYYANWEKYVLRNLYAANNELTLVTVPATRQIWNIDLSNNKISNFDLQNYDGLLTLDLSNNLLTEEVSLAYLGAAKSIKLAGNKIERVVYDTFTDLETFDISDNNFTIETLPYPAPAANYSYAPQKEYALLANSPAVNLTDQNRVLVDGKGTTFTWKKADGSLLVEGVDINCTDGATRFLKTDLGKIYCEMTNPAFPDFSGDNIYRTTLTNVVGAPDKLVATFTTTEDANNGEVIFATKAPSALYIDWRGDGTEYLPYNTQKTYTGYTDVRTFKDANVKVYTYEDPADVTVFSIYGIPMSDFNGESLTSLNCLALGEAGLTPDQMKLPDAPVTELTLSGNLLTEYPYYEKYPNLVMLNLSENEFETFDASQLKDLQVLFLYGNKLTDLTLENPALWQLEIGGNQFESIDLSGLKILRQFGAYGNKLKTIDMRKFRASLVTLNLTGNEFTFSTLPAPSDFPYLTTYLYGNQAPIEAIVSDDYMTYDLSSEAMIKNMYATTYTWFLGKPVFDSDSGELTGETLIEDDEYTIENGVTTFNYKFNDDVYCALTNSLFPQGYLMTPGYRIGYAGAVNEIAGEKSENVDVYTVSGMIIRRGVDKAEATKELPAGIYIVGGKKVIVK